MAIGGGFWGKGISQSVHKIFYLPEAHTDFIFAIVCEELGFVGGMGVLLGYLTIVLRIYQWAYRFAQEKNFFFAYYAVGIASWFSIQVCIAAGVNMCLLPTKGLGMPLLSCGGSHLVCLLLALGVLFSMIATIASKFKHELLHNRCGVSMQNQHFNSSRRHWWSCFSALALATIEQVAKAVWLGTDRAVIDYLEHTR